jgi:hypothetical protein
MTPFETVVADDLAGQGYRVFSSGWPDFCAIKQTGDTTEVRFIEAIGRGDMLRASQQKLHGILRMLGFEVEVIQEDAKYPMQYPPALRSGVRIVRKEIVGRPALGRQKSISFLEDELKQGPQPVQDLLIKASDSGISRATLYRTKTAMGIVQTGKGRKKIWELPVVCPEEKQS